MSEKVERNAQYKLSADDFFVDAEGHVVITNAAISEALKGLAESPEETSESAAIRIGLIIQ